MTSQVVNHVNKSIVVLYKVIGFAALLAIAGGLFSFFAIQLFFLANRSWAAPVILSPTHEHVLELNARLAGQQTVRDELVAEREAVRAQIAAAERSVDALETHQRNVESALAADARFAKESLVSLEALSKDFARSIREHRETSKSFEELDVDRANELYRANMLDRHAYVSSMFSAAQIAQNRVSYGEQHLELKTRMRDLRRQISAIHDTNASLKSERFEVTDSQTMTFTIATAQREHVQARLDQQVAHAEIRVLKLRLGDLENSIQRYDHLLETISNSPYLRASNENITIAFVPYENASRISRGDLLYACEVEIVWCRRVGKVVDWVDGEVTYRHPTRNEMLRGQMLELQIDDPEASRYRLLHADRAPLLF